MQKNKIPKILVAGSINMDLVLPIERVPDPGETLFGVDYSFIPGGKGANQAVAAARLGAEVSFCGRVGNDDNGETLRSGLKHEGIGTSLVLTDDTLPTGLAVIPVESDGQNRIMVFSGANMAVSKSDADRAMEEYYDAVIMQLEIPLETIFHLYDSAREKGVPVILDAGPAMSLPLENLCGIDIISPNESEAFALTGIRPDTEELAVQAAETIARRSAAKYVVIKMGGRGALLYDSGRAEVFPAFGNVKPIDTTAAGDAFTAAMSIEWIRTGDIRAAIRYANATGALTVSRKGAQPSLPTAREIECFIKFNEYDLG